MAHKANRGDERDYLAVLTVNGVGSWGRDKDKDKAVKTAVRIFKLDFKSVFKLTPGKKLKVDVLDVTGHDTVTWDATGFYTKSEKLLPRPEVIEVTL